MGEGSNLVEHASAPAAGPRSHTAARHISLQARTADTQVPSAVEGKIDCTLLYCGITTSLQEWIRTRIHSCTGAWTSGFCLTIPPPLH